MITNVHKPIMVKEISSFLNNDKELSILDCTFGGGGHTLSFLELGHRVMAIDEDLKAQEIAKELRAKFNKLNFFKINFKDFEKIDGDYLKNKFDFILLDLGFSSNQLEDVQIGISFKENSKLNMNYLNSGFTAYDVINNYSEEQLSRVFADYGEIKQSLKLAKFIVRTRQGKSINTNFDLIEVLRGSGVTSDLRKFILPLKLSKHLELSVIKSLRI